MSINYFSALVLTSIFSLTLTACGSGGHSSESDLPPRPKNSGFSATAIQTSDIDSSPLCPTGGVKINTGVDVNQNGTLDTNEINETQELCHLDTDRILANVEELNTNTECSNGGHRLNIGYDLNQSDSIEH